MPRQRKLSTQEKKDSFLRLTQNGMARVLAAHESQTTPQGVDYYRRSDPVFRQQDDQIKKARDARRSGIPLQDPATRGMISFQRFCEEYLDTKLFDHHLQWLDLLEGRTPRKIHPNQKYEPGSPDFILVNTPPEHSKSTTITINYVTYRICEDPNVRVIIVSQTQEMAKRFLRGIKDRLASTNQAYRKLQIDFAPDGGFDKDSAAWTSDSIYVSSSLRDSGEPTPTVLALGLGGQIYGNRADLIIFDDTVTGKNAHEFAKQMDWMQREVYNRLSPTGKMLLIGTRLAPNDLYSEIRKSEYYNDEGSPWTYLTQPAVLELTEDPKDWVTLWPRTNRKPVSLAARNAIVADEDGLYPMWDGPALSKRRSTMGPRNWALVYQQEDVVEDATFPQKDVIGCIDGMRQAGPMVSGAPGHRDHGQDGCYVIGGFDPATTGHSAAVVMAVDRMSGVRWVLDVWTRAHQKPEDLFDKLKEWTLKYRVNEWRIEKNAMNTMVSQSRPLNEWMASRGVKISEHFTGSNKWDQDWGVSSMSMLFKGHENGSHLIRLPSRSGGEGVKALVEQLTTWEPLPPGVKTKKKSDTVMALWFAEIRARDLVNEMNTAANKLRISNPYMSSRDQDKKFTVDLDHMANQQIYGNDTGRWWGR
jgi:Terminase RNaseH-like domain